MSSDAARVTADDVNGRLIEYLERQTELRIERARDHALLAQRLDAHLADHKLWSDRLWKAFFVLLTVALGLLAKEFFG